MRRDGTSWGRQSRTWGSRANRAAHGAAQRIDDTTGVATDRLAAVIVPAVLLLRWPTAVVLWFPIPLIVTVVVLGWRGDGLLGDLLVALGIALAAVSAAFGGRRRRILQAVDDPALLRDELRQLVNLTGRVDDGAATVRELGSGEGVRAFARLRTVWRGVSLPAKWLDDIGRLRRARYFAPPKIGTTVTVTVAAVWVVPVSVVAAIVAAIGSLAGTV